MELLKGVLQLIVSAASQPGIGFIQALLLFYLAVAAFLLLARLIRGVRKC